jgi:ArsR family transcriptional regulator
VHGSRAAQRGWRAAGGISPFVLLLVLVLVRARGISPFVLVLVRAPPILPILRLSMRLTDKQLERIASALAEPRRFRILKDLAAREVPIQCGTIADKHGVTNATISHHLKELEAAGLIEIVREGKFGNVTFRRDVWAAYLAKLTEL